MVPVIWLFHKDRVEFLRHQGDLPARLVTSRILSSQHSAQPSTP